MYIARQVSASLNSQTNYPVSTYNHDNLSDLLSKSPANTTFEKIHLRPEVTIGTPHPVTERISN